jgi:hypothetical protein
VTGLGSKPSSIVFAGDVEDLNKMVQKKRNGDRRRQRFCKGH